VAPGDPHLFPVRPRIRRGARVLLGPETIRTRLRQHPYQEALGADRAPHARGHFHPPPAGKEQIETYFADYLYSDALSPKEDYRYGERLVGPKYRKIERPDLAQRHVEVEPPKDMGVNQVREVIRIYREGGAGTNQCTMEIAMPNDILLQDPPCCRLIDTRVRYGRLHFVIYFRSWDLYAGFPVNLGGMELLKQMMASEIGVENGSMVVASKGLHIYEQYYELVECQTQLSIDQLRGEGEEKARRMGL
jgi:thymidylate synthase